MIDDLDGTSADCDRELCHSRSNDHRKKYQERSRFLFQMILEFLWRHAFTVIGSHHKMLIQFWLPSF